MINAKTISLLSLAFLVALAIFGVGMMAGKKEWAVARLANEGLDTARSLLRTGMILPELGYFRRPQYAPDQRYLISNKDQIMPGFIAVSRIDATAPRYVVDLLDKDGEAVHSWQVDYSKLVEGGQPLIFSHATRVMPDGTLLLSFDGGRALARLDQCGNTMWARTDQIYHHVIQPAEDGFWAWSATVSDASDDQAMVRFDPETGDILETINIIEVSAVSLANALNLSIPDDYKFARDAWKFGMGDIFHPNDVEPLPASMADAFPQFSAGDLLISLRNLNLLAVLDRDTHKILWAARGPWIRQHDPDWQPDGTITVFNNNTERQRSNIIRIDPKTDAISVLFEGAGPKFFSFIMGNHERLPNGNWLLSSSMEGRVIEVTDAGETVREYSNIINESYSAIVSNAQFLPQDYLETLPNCAL